jgi:LuxR family maltose regulon positive regulatory protein
VGKLLAAFGEGTKDRQWTTQAAIPSLVEPLTERELEVLRLMAAGKSNQEIADELIIAISTVRSHVKSIYGKLGASNRVQAMLRARQMGLVK